MRENRIAIIPARGGSKRIPRKNIKPFLGRPIIAYSIEAAIESGLFGEVMVSTDDPEIADIAKFYGAKIPFFRSNESATDIAGTAEVLNEVIEHYKRFDKRSFITGCCLYPTAPFVTATLLKDTLRIFETGNYDVLLPVMRYSYPVQRSLRQLSNGKVIMRWPENYSGRSQDFEPVFHDAGQFYWYNLNYMHKYSRLVSDNTYGFEISNMQGQDIDNETDWQLAELKYKFLNLKNKA